jgi:hypothetical protein
VASFGMLHSVRAVNRQVLAKKLVHPFRTGSRASHCVTGCKHLVTTLQGGAWMPAFDVAVILLVVKPASLWMPWYEAVH